MSQSFAEIAVHLVFSTSERRAYFQNEELRLRSFAQIGGICKQLKCPLISVGGHVDHVHVLAKLGKTITVSEWVKELKRVSCLWLKENEKGFEKFHWQNGYAAFAVSSTHVQRVQHYIQHQKEHHESKCFQNELLEMLQRANLEYDERYLWN